MTAATVTKPVENLTTAGQGARNGAGVVSTAEKAGEASAKAPLGAKSYRWPFAGLHLTAAGLESGDEQGWLAIVPLAPGQSHERLLLYLPEGLRQRLRLEPLTRGECTQPCCQEQLALPLGRTDTGASLDMRGVAPVE